MTGPDPVPGLRLTEQQAAPMSVIEASVALCAGAGCGKTTVLTARFLGDLDEPEPRPLSALVAMTFTEKAARELRQRIRKQSRERLLAGADIARWRGILRALEAAPIGTFHEFCGQWLRRHALEAGIDPDFAILDASIAGTVRDEVLARCLRQWLAERDADLIDLAVEFGLRRVREALAGLIAERDAGRLAEWEGRGADEVVAIWKASWEKKARAMLLQRVGSVARPCLALLAENECAHPVMRERRRFLREAIPSLERCDDPDPMLAAILENTRVQGGGTAKDWPSPGIYKDVKDQLEVVRSAIKKAREQLAWDESATREAAELGLRFARLASKARRAYDEAKRARGGLDFDDLLIKTRDLLRDHAAAVRNAPYGALQRVLVDEFQDTDPIQGEILERLTGEAFPSGRLFLVGDAKQSIYRFRGARPEILEEFRDRFPESGRLSLTENFRSVPGILDFVNALFADTFEDPDAALIPVVGPVPDHDQPVVEFLWATESEEAAKSSKSSAHDRRELEARWLARRLRQRLDVGWMVRDRQTREVRQAHPGDVAFLFRAMTDVGPYESALVEEGFDYHVIGGSAFYAQQEVHDLINVLSVIEDPLDAVALAGTLRGPFFCLSDDGLFWLSTARHDLVEGLQNADAIAQLSERDRQNARRARDLLAHWRGLKDRVAIAALVDRVLDESGYEAALLGEFLGDRKRANARKLVRLARQFDQQGGFTLAAFVARLRADLKRPPREEQAATTDEQGTSVRLMSIHQAKGLEFPIVVIPDLNRKPAADLDAVAFDPTLGPLVRRGKDRAAEPGTSAKGDDAADEGTRESLGWLAYQSLERHHEEKEALRLFYVATTRARDALILSAGLGPSEKPRSPAMCLLEQRFDCQTGRCLAPLPEGWQPPIIHVTREALVPAPSPSPSSGRTRTRGGRLPLFEVAEAIDRSPVAGVVAAPAAPRRPRFVDFDPAWGLAPTLARLDRLIRAILAESRAWNLRDLARVATQAARRHDPMAPPSRVDEAIACLKPWIGGRIGQDVAGSESAERGVAWTISWPPDAADATVFRGVADLVARDRQGDLQVILFSIVGASEPRERLRLLLSVRAAESLGLGRVRRGWRIRLGPGGGLSGEECFDAAAIDAAVRETLDLPPA